MQSDQVLVKQYCLSQQDALQNLVGACKSLIEDQDASETNFSLIFLLRSIKTIFTSSPNSNPIQASNFDFSQFCECLKLVLQSGKILCSANAIDCLYEVWSENWYDKHLENSGIMSLLQQVKLENIKFSKSDFSPQEQDEISEALENLKPFIEYKLNNV